MLILTLQCLYTLCLKKRHPFYICHNLVRCHPIYPILGRNMPHEICNKHSCTAHHSSFHMSVLYLVKSSNDFYGIQYSRPTASNMKSPQKSEIVTSDSYELTLILSEQVFEVSSISSHTGAKPPMTHNRVPCRRHAGADQTRSCSDQAPLQFTFLVENLYKFKDFGVRRLILEFSDKS